MPNTIIAGAVALNLAGSFMPGTLPPEPPKEHPHAHAAWAKIQNMHVIKPHLERHEGVFHAPAMKAAISADSSTSANWSGSAISGGETTYAMGAVAMSVLVPTTSAAFGCNKNTDTGNGEYTAVWNGIDGFGTGTVEQAGIQIVSNCVDPADIGTFIEVYPNPEVAITNFPISVGDMIDVWTWINRSISLTCAAWENESKQTYTTACLKDPQQIAAGTVEWIVERPLIGSALATLGNYITIPIWSAMAWDYQTSKTLGSSSAPPSAWSATGTLYSVDMVDASDNVISHPNQRWWDTLFMYDMGAAYCTPGDTCEPRD